MAIANNNGWDFVEVNNSYLYVEFGFSAVVKILENNSTEKEYRFKVRVKKTKDELPRGLTSIFDIHYTKDDIGYMAEKIQIYIEQ